MLVLCISPLGHLPKIGTAQMGLGWDDMHSSDFLPNRTVQTCAMPPPQEGFSCLGFLASWSACSSSAPPSSRVPFSLSLYTVLAARPVLSASSCAKRSLSACTQHACALAADQPPDLELFPRLCRKLSATLQALEAALLYCLWFGR